MKETIKIQVLFEEDTPHGKYTDALYFTPEEYQNKKQEDIDKEKQTRVDNWIKCVNTPPPEPTKEELEYMKQIAEESIAQFISQKDSLDLQIQSIKAVPMEEPLEEKKG